jgi:hypothetical protein
MAERSPYASQVEGRQSRTVGSADVEMTSW